MKKLNPVKFFIAFFLLTALVSMLVFPAVEWVKDMLVTHTEFVYSVADHIVHPIIFAAVLSVIVTLTTKWDKINKK